MRQIIYWVQERADLDNKNRGRKKKLGVNEPLKEYVYEKLGLEWSPEEIAKRIKIDYPKSRSMKIFQRLILEILERNQKPIIFLI